MFERLKVFISDRRKLWNIIETYKRDLETANRANGQLRRHNERYRDKIESIEKG